MDLVRSYALLGHVSMLAEGAQEQP
jgi:hypothetical protein